jgi:hypothetical protein
MPALVISAEPIAPTITKLLAVARSSVRAKLCTFVIYSLWALRNVRPTHAHLFAELARIVRIVMRGKLAHGHLFAALTGVEREAFDIWRVQDSGEQFGVMDLQSPPQ